MQQGVEIRRLLLLNEAACRLDDTQCRLSEGNSNAQKPRHGKKRGHRESPGKTEAQGFADGHEPVHCMCGEG